MILQDTIPVLAAGGDRFRHWEPERKLVLAVFETGKDDLITYASSKFWRGRLLFAEAKAWLDSDEAYPFSYVFCCQVLGFDPEATRDALRATVERRIGGPRASRRADR